MAKPFHLQSLVDLAQERSDAAAQTLAKLKRVWQEAENKRAQLESYLQEYRNRLQQQTESGLTAMQWQDYQAFMAKLELAIKAQSAEIDRCQRAWEAGQIDWQACERELKAYLTLRERHEAAERKREDKQEQKLQDEYARNLHHRKTHPQDG